MELATDPYYSWLIDLENEKIKSLVSQSSESQDL